MLKTKPTTFEEAVEDVIEDLKYASKDNVLDLNPASHHHSYGMTIRNAWDLWGDSALSRNIKRRFGIGHADDMSSLIMETAFAAFKGETFDINAKVEHYKNYWNDRGIDPLTQEELN